jgi:hypothetical protein
MKINYLKFLDKIPYIGVIDPLVIMLLLMGFGCFWGTAQLGMRRKPPATIKTTMASSLDPDVAYTGLRVAVEPLEQAVITAAVAMREDFALLLTPQGTLVVRPQVTFEPMPTPVKLESPQLTGEKDHTATSMPTPQFSPLDTLNSTTTVSPTMVNVLVLTVTPSPTATFTLTLKPTPSSSAYE